MDNEFHSKDGDQNVAQGDGAIGKQENAAQEARDGNIFSGTGNVTVNQGLRIKPHTSVLAVVVLAVIGGSAYYLVEKNSISITGDNKGTAVIAGGNVTVKGVDPEVFAKYIKELGATEQVVNGFFNTLLEQKVPRDQWDSKLREIAATHKELLARLATVQSQDPEVVRLKGEARQAISAGEYAKAEDLLNQAEARDLEAIEEMEESARQRRISAAATNADQANLQRVQLRYAKAAEYLQKAAALLPKGEKKDRSLYLHQAGYDLDRISRYSEALPLYEQSLAIRKEIGDRAGEGTTLNNIGQIYKARGDYATAFKYLEQSLVILQAIGDRAGEGITLNNISQIYDAQGDYATALKYLEQSLAISQEIGDRAGEGTTLNNIAGIHRAHGDYATALKYLEQSLAILQAIGDRKEVGTILNNISQIYKARGDYATALKYLYLSLDIRQAIGDRAGEGTTLNNIAGIHRAHGDYATALKYLEQSLAICREIGDRVGELVTSWNIGRIYQRQGDLSKAERYISRAVQIMAEIGHPELEGARKALEELRAKRRGM